MAFQKVGERGMGDLAGARGKGSILLSFCGWDTMVCSKELGGKKGFILPYRL